MMHKAITYKTSYCFYYKNYIWIGLQDIQISISNIFVSAVNNEDEP